jgi:hypothetical protein
MQLAGFTEAHAKGEAKRALFLVPSVVQGQFGGEALRYLEPGKYKWHAEPGASRDERIAAYKDPSHHFAVMTHSAFRDDMLHLGAQHAGIDPGAMRAKLDSMTPADRKAWAKSVMEKEGINFDYMAVDEGHNLLNRAGKENSGMANVIDAVSAHTPYYVSATADPVKNDASEAFSVLEKMDPGRYNDRAAFMRRYGADTKSARDGLRRELARHLYPSRIVPKVRADKREVSVDLSPAQLDDVHAIDKHVAAARIARMTGGVDVAAVRALAPSHFDGVPEDQHEAIAKALTRNVGLLKESAMNRAINDHERSAKLDHVAKLAAERHGKPGVVFAHSLTAVDNLRKRLESSGHKVITLTGSDSSKQKAAKLREFQDEGSTAILVASDAGSTGANMQHGQWLVQYDTPDTAMTHAQRAGRIHRIGQKNDVELIDLVANHAHERRARKRLAEKHELRELMTSPLESLEDDPRGLGHYLAKSKLT